ncbi:MAG: hypothetical protein V1880_00990 [Patescibacteria group bacterium]
MRKKTEDMTLEEKVDAILKYQKSLHRMAIIRSVFGFLIFFVLVVLPIYGVFYLMDYLRNTMGFSFTEIGETLNHIKNITEGGNIESLKNLMQ